MILMRAIASTMKNNRAGTNGTAPGALTLLPHQRSGWEGFKRFFWKYKFFHLLVLPGVIYYIVFHYLPMIGVAIAFNDYNGMGGLRGMVTAPWVGFKNFTSCSRASTSGA